MVRWLACRDSGGSPPTSATTSSRRTRDASARVLPAARTVSADAHPIDATHPCARKRSSSIRPSTTRAVSCRTSPHAGFSTSATAFASATAPVFRGCSKWSSNFGENIRYLPAATFVSWDAVTCHLPARRTNTSVNDSFDLLPSFISRSSRPCTTATLPKKRTFNGSFLQDL